MRASIHAREVRAAAAAWLSRRDAGLAPADEILFKQWLSEDPAHEEAVRALEPAWAAANRPRRSGDGGGLRKRVATAVRARRRRQRRIAGRALAIAAVLTVASIVWQRPRLASAVPEPSATVAVRPNEQVLTDGTRVQLNAGADIRALFSPAERRVRLLAGEAMFDVAKDPARPFTVDAGSVRVRALGTAFSVRLGGDQVTVLVTEGRVAVAPAGPATVADASAPGDPSTVYLSAGGKVDVAANGSVRPVPSTPVQVTSEEIQKSLAWRERRMEFTGTPLGDAVTHFRGMAGTRLAVADDATGAIRISGVFWTDDPEAFSRNLEVGLGLKATRRGDRIVMSRR